MVRLSSSGCAFVAAGEERARPFECGSVLVGLQPGVRVADLREFLQAVRGRVVRNRSTTAAGWVLVHVPQGSEQDAVLRAYADRRVRNAGFNWSGIVIRGR